MSLTPKNWKEFQHYKDRSPSWIKLHRGLLDNIDYFRLSAEAGKSLPLIWLIASERDGRIPEAGELAFRLRLPENVVSSILVELMQRGFLIEAEHVEHVATQDATPAQRAATANGFGSRHISDAVKREVWARDGGKCRKCNSTENVEYDHIHPVSKGGNSEKENIQLLCRPCNRSKRTSVAAPAEQVDTDAPGSRSLEKRREENIEKIDSRSIETDRPARAPSRFDDFWKAYPRRDGPNPRKPAENKFSALVKSGLDPEMMIAEAKKLAQAESARGNIGTRFIPQAITWLSQQRWADHAAVAFLASEAGAEMPAEDAVKMLAQIGRWSRWAGPEPGQLGCKASPELLAKYGLAPDGRKLALAS